MPSTSESFFATLKNEMYHLRKWPTRDEARHAVVEFIESYYNRRRPHSTIGYRIPAEAMDGFFERTEPMLETAHEQAAEAVESGLILQELVSEILTQVTLLGIRDNLIGVSRTLWGRREGQPAHR